MHCFSVPRGSHTDVCAALQCSKIKALRLNLANCKQVLRFTGISTLLGDVGIFCASLHTSVCFVAMFGTPGVSPQVGSRSVESGIEQ
ncbi:hypothetical protein FOLKNPGA_00671 [Legionella sp. PC1000]|nr:hypothetical protein FOLKNPGA_00671 [Legionella sp. PC1000]